MLEFTVQSAFNNGSGGNGGSYSNSRRRRRRCPFDNEQEQAISKDLKLFDIFDELANVVSSELSSMERAKRVNVSFESRI